MEEKPTLYVDYEKGNIKGPGKIIARLFAGPKDKSWFPTEVSIIPISDPERLRQTVEKLRNLGFPLVETPAPDTGAS